MHMCTGKVTLSTTGLACITQCFNPFADPCERESLTTLSVCETFLFLLSNGLQCFSKIESLITHTTQYVILTHIHKHQFAIDFGHLNENQG